MDEKTRLIYRVAFWISGIVMLVVVLYGILASAHSTPSSLISGVVFVNIDWPFSPVFAKPVTYLSTASVAFIYCGLRLWEQKISAWPASTLSFLQLLGFVVAFASAYEVLYNFMLWGSFLSYGLLTSRLVTVGLVNSASAPGPVPWNLVFATRAFSALFVISGYSVYFLRRMNKDRLI